MSEPQLVWLEERQAVRHEVVLAALLDKQKNPRAALNRSVYEALLWCNPSNCLLRTTTCVGQ